MNKKILPLTLGGLGLGTTEFVMMGLLPDIAKSLAVSIPQAGYLISAYALGLVVGSPVLVLISGKYPPKKILIGLIIMLLVFNTFSAFAPTFNLLLLGRFLSGLPHGAFFGVGSIVATKVVEKNKEAQAVSLMFMGLTLANIIGVPLSAFLGHILNWRASFAVTILCGLFSLITLKLWLPETKADKTKAIKDELAFFKSTNSWIIMLLTAIGFGGLFTWYSYIAPLVTEVGQIPLKYISYVLMLSGIGMLVGTLLGGRFADRYSPAKTAAVLLLLMVVDLVIVHFVSQYTIPCLIMTFITGGTAFALIPVIQVLTIRSAKGIEMFAGAISQACFGIANALGAFLGGIPLEMNMDYTWPAIVGVGMALTGALLTIWLIIRNRKIQLISEI